MTRAAQPAGEFSATRAFFAARAEDWDSRFAEDGPAFERAVADLGPARGATVLDVGCGTGRAAPVLAAAVGPSGRVVGLDVTPEMLAGARFRRFDAAALVLGDADQLPIADAIVDAVLAAGLLTHVADPAGTLRELARVVRPGGRLAVFHPVGRAALAARHGPAPRRDDLLDPSVLPGALAATGWELETLDDAADRYFARACIR